MTAAADDKTPLVQILIVLYNSAGTIGSCLEAVNKLTYPNYRVWVLDNASTDGGADVVERDFPDAHLIRLNENRGFAGGNNLLAEKEPEANFLFLLNPDTEIFPHALDRLMEAFATRSDLGVAGCMLLAGDRKTIHHVGGTIDPNGLTHHLGEGEVDRGQYAGLLPCAYVQGAALMIRRSLWNELGGFDEGYFPAYFEEADLCMRAARAGHLVAVVAEAKAVHHQDAADQLSSRRFLKLYLRGRARFLRKNYSLADWLVRFLPAEMKWLKSPHSKGLRRLAIRSLFDEWFRKGRLPCAPGNESGRELKT